MKNLKEVMISVSDFKSKLSEIIKENLTKIIVKNNEPVAVIMPYSEYVKKIEGVEQSLLGTVGQELTLDNGVQIVISAGKDKEGFFIKTFAKINPSDDYKLYCTQYMNNPNGDQILSERKE